MRIYLAGPMRGYPDLNSPAFHAAADWLRSRGHTVFNPAEHNVDEDIRICLATDTAWICVHAEAIYLLPDWYHSRGARAERALGEALGLEIVEL